LPGMNKVPQYEIERQYRIYLNEIEEQRIAIYLMQEQMTRAEAIANEAISHGGGYHIVQEQSELPSGCIQFVNNTTDGNTCLFWINTSAPTNYTITWGDGETTTGEVNGVDQAEIEHSYPDADTEYTARICFDDISLVTYLEFNGDD
jgi:hypothetical protein